MYFIFYQKNHDQNIAIAISVWQETLNIFG